MNLFRILLAGLAGTTLMTAYSYVVAEKKRKQFREPQILNKLLQRMDLPVKVDKYHPAGWVLHYKVGIFFSIIYDLLWRKTSIQPTLKNSVIMGGITGVFGILVWKTTFYLHPNPPNLHFRDYYRQLLIAHILFGIFARIGYQSPNVIEKDTLATKP